MKHVSLPSKRPRGAAVVFTVVSMVMVVSFAALAIDVGHLYVVKAELQAAADAAALAAAATMYDEEGLNPPKAVAEAALYAGRNLKVAAQTALGQMEVAIGRIDAPFRLDSPFVPAVDESANAVRVVVCRDRAHGNPVPLIFANIFGKSHSDVSAVAVAGLRPPDTPDIVPIALRAPNFGPVDPDIVEQNPGKDGPSYPTDGEAFQIGEQVTVFAFGKGPRQPVHLVLDPPEYNGVAITDRLLADTLRGDEPPITMTVGTEMPVWNGGTGDGNFGQKLMERMQDGDDDNDTIVMPIVEILPDSRDSSGRITGNVRIADFVGVRLDDVVEAEVQDPRFPDDPTKTLTIELIVGTVMPVVLDGGTAEDPAELAHSVFTLQLLR